VNDLLKVEGLTKRFGSRAVLDDVTLSVRPREILGLIGPNGSGKTTLFECVAGLMPRNAGTIRFGANDVATKSPLFYLPDGIVPWKEQRVNWALSFFAQIFGRAKEEISDLIQTLKLESLTQSHISSLSKGERKRLLLAMGLLTSHPLLLLDEPFEGLDLRQTREVMELLRNHVARGRTLMLSIHQLIDAGRVCDRLVLLSEGKVVGEGSLTELRSLARLPEGGVEEIFLALT
jgi:ABC-type multidrug transport system ATPase subunit